MEPQIEIPYYCKYCHLQIGKDDPFCWHCGKLQKDESVSTGFWSLLWLFILSTVFPPLGLGKTIKYMKADEEKARVVGWISMILTILAIVFGVISFLSFYSNLNSQFLNY